MMYWNEKVYLKWSDAKNINYIEKCFKQKLHRIKFATKNSADAYLNLLMEWSQGAPKIFYIVSIAIVAVQGMLN